MENYTYMTLLTNNTYVQGVILLNETLKKVKSKYPLTVLVTNEVAQATLDILDYLEIKWKLVDIIKLPKQIQILSDERNKKSNYIPPYRLLSKAQIYNQYEYDKIMFLDSDIMILKNIDFLFQNEIFTATYNFQYQQDMPQLKFIENNKIFKINYNMIFDKERINSGFLLFSPKKEKINLINFIQTLDINIFTTYQKRIESDESMLELYLRQYPRQINILNRYYNTAYFANTPEIITKDIKENSYFIHLTGLFKPWDFHNNLFTTKCCLNKKSPYIAKQSLIYDAIEIIQNIIFQLPYHLMYNFCKVYLIEIEKLSEKGEKNE